MARIADGVIEQLKTDVSVQRLAEARGVVFARHGADLIGRCPFHEDRTPSLVVTPAAAACELIQHVISVRTG
jgi:DNA primase